MLPVIIQVLEMKASEDSIEAVEVQKGLKVKLEDPVFVLKLSFLYEISYFLTLLSKEFKKDNVFPYKAKQAEQKTKQFLDQARDALREKRLPSVLEKVDKWVPWQQFIAIFDDLKTGVYKGLPMVLKGQQGHKTRTTSASANDNLESVLTINLEELSKYLDTLLDLKNSDKHWGRFQWPEWLSLVEKCFDFKKDIQASERKEAFGGLLNIMNSPHSLTEKEESVLKEEYATLILVIKSVMSGIPEKTLKKTPMEDILYKVYTEPSLYSNSKKVLAYALRWLSKTFNESKCESFFHALKEIDDSGKPLNFETVEDLCFIKYNGPNPLKAKTLIRGALNRHFDKKPWHFVTESKKFFISPCVSGQLKEANESFSLFD